MAYDNELADRMRAVLANRDDVREKAMFGGLAFLVRGHMAVGLIGDDLTVRTSPENAAEALTKPHVRPMDFTGRPMKGWLFVSKDGAESDAALQEWIDVGVTFALSLPPK